MVTPGCEWVLAGEGTATRKYDGTCCMLDADGQWWNRREIRAGKTMPADAIDLGEDEATGKRMCWVPNSAAGNRANLLAALDTYDGEPVPGTYELCAPNIDTRSGPNPENLTAPLLIRHETAERVRWPPVTKFAAAKALVMAGAENGWEGIVWHHPDGRRAKLKARDFPA